MSRPLPHYSVPDVEYLNEIEFDTITNDDAVALGLIAVQVIQEWDLNLAVEIVLHGDVVFKAKLKSTNADNDPWLAGKAAVVNHFGEASLVVKLRHLAAGTPFEDRTDVDHDRYKAHGGSIPLWVDGAIIGTMTMSGEPDAIDHEAAAEALARFVSSRNPSF
ncbi:heme-binding protein [Salinibacterium sp. NSLL150]|uniref:heme-binding protein n=1 Tax=unclassified Salinibacterium TaxID=2632331 RepID=UPI0018CD4B69|nr:MULTISPECIES: heme-binding protein [unclassified Salinibacterium]MBH0099196.1 heme-binding protein [Salinibacterium sp. NSLL35]MBH0101950.1 heme-binding protein [Salinibacterium sp. NSLL150]MBH0104710.1 heme-binding protein [Salinibacterium sp. NSLL16]MBH0107470.1 heme-binding protein [Salinibacterium sp. NSLL17]